MKSNTQSNKPKMIKDQMTGRKLIGEINPIFSEGRKYQVQPQGCIPLPQKLRIKSVKAKEFQLNKWNQGSESLKTRIQQELKKASDSLKIQKKLQKAGITIYLSFVFTFMISAIVTFLCTNDNDQFIIALIIEGVILSIMSIPISIIWFRMIKKQVKNALYQINMKNDGYQLRLKNTKCGQYLNIVQVYEIQ